MKKILIVIMLFTVKASFAQKDTVGLSIPIKDQKIVYEGIVQIPNKSKQDIYLSAEKWFITKFNTLATKLINQDKEAGQLISKESLTTTIRGRMGTPWNFNNQMTIQIDCRDNKFRYRIFDIITSLPGGNIDETPLETPYYSLVSGKWVINKGFTKSLLQNSNADILALIENMKTSLSAKKDNF